ncbi:MAG: molybdopterin molybdotransferase MoeA [Spirochaetes bacterium]|nr:molybdopterin molybdotransferase MoeA [Spirochaetota bacterium]
MSTTKLEVSFGEARDIVLKSVQPLGFEDISIFEATDRVLYDNIISDIITPPLDNSSMDGYAIIAEDSRGASNEKPIKLEIIDEIQAGGTIAGKKVERGSAIRIMTGAPIPEGADAVIQFEDTEEENDTVKVFREVKKHENYRFAGENIQKGDHVLDTGERITSADLGLLASLNYKTVKVYKKPTVAIIATGDEIVDIGENIKHGQIRNSNAYTLYSEVKKYGAVPHYFGIAKDTIDDTKIKFTEALKSDVVISTGGVSMGKYDFVKEIYSALNIEIKFEWVKVKPGRPFTFGKKDNKLIFGLPGNPVSTLTTFIQFVRPALLKLMNAKRLNKPIVNAFLEETIYKEPGKVHLIRGYFRINNNELYVTTTGNQSSGVLRSMSLANCLIIIPETTAKVNAGEKVAIQLFNHDEIEETA